MALWTIIGLRFQVTDLTTVELVSHISVSETVTVVDFVAVERAKVVVVRIPITLISRQLSTQCSRSRGRAPPVGVLCG